MIKEYTTLGFMSGTSGDGVDASIIRSDGKTKYKVILDKYFEYNQEIYQQIHSLKQKINNEKDLIKLKKDIGELEKNITLFHANIFSKVSKNNFIDLIGFHGQTIYHNFNEKISKQLGNANLLSQLTKKKIVYNFRENDLKNGGQGAPLTPIFHKLIINQNQIDTPSCILNLGGIANITFIPDNNINNLRSTDIGPGNCLIDEWIRLNSKSKFDASGLIAAKGKVNEVIIEQVQDLYQNIYKDQLSLDTKDFSASFARGLSLEDGAATLTEFTARIINESLYLFLKNNKNQKINIYLCGGGRKNLELINRLKNKIQKNLKILPIDDLGLDGDFIESQAFAFLAIRSFLGLEISYPKATGCLKPCVGGDVI